jgi:carbamoyltransferase
MRTEMDYLVVGDYLFQKSEQPQWKDNKNWQKEYELD